MLPHKLIVAVCICRLVMISIERSETAQKSALEIRDKFSLRQNAVQDKIQSENFFLTVGENFFWTEFCLGLHTAVVFRMQSFNLIVGTTRTTLILHSMMPLLHWYHFSI